MASPEYQQFETQAPAGGGMDLRVIYRTLIERAWLIALCLVASAFITYGYVKRAPVVYAATAIIQVDQPKQIINLNDPENDSSKQDPVKITEAGLQSRALMERVLRTNNLVADPRFLLPTETNMTVQKMISKLGSLLLIKSQPGKPLINVTVEHANPAFTEKIANSVVQEYINWKFETRDAFSDLNYDKLRRLKIEKEIEIKLAEAQLQAIQQADKGVSIEDRLRLLDGQITALGVSESETRKQINTLEYELGRSRELGDNTEVLQGLLSVAGDVVVAQTRSAILQQRGDFETLKGRYGPKHYKYQEATNRLAGLQIQLAAATSNAVKRIKTDFDGARAKLADIEKDKTERLTDKDGLQKKAAQYEAARKDLQAKKDLQSRIVSRMEELAVISDVDKSNIQIFQKAYVPEKPIKPNRQQILMTGIMAGLLCGLAIAFGLNALDNSFKTPEETEEFLRLPLLSAIPHLRAVAAGRKQLIMMEEAETFGAEAFRSLRTTVAMLGPAAHRRSFLFTSALPAEGKTFCAVNYALSLAQQGLRTVLIDCDLRCPAVEKTLLGELTKYPGVANYLSGQTGFADIIRTTKIENFSSSPRAPGRPTRRTCWPRRVLVS